MQRQHQSGYAVLWVLITFAFIAMGYAAASLWGVGPDPEDTELWWPVYIVSWVAILAGGVVEYRRDKWEFARFAAFFGWITFVVAAFGALVGRGVGSIVAAVAALSLAIWSIVFKVRENRRQDTVPNVLAQTFGLPALVERDGVQFIASLTPSGALTLHAQNCYDRPRALQLSVTKTIVLGGGELAPLSPVQHTLGPLEVIRIDLVLAASKSGRIDLVVDVGISGSGGTRQRSKRAPDYHPFVHEAGMLIGVKGGGLRFRWEAVAGTAPVPAQAKVMWAPAAG